MKHVRFTKILQNQKYLLHFFAAFFVLLFISIGSVSGQTTNIWDGSTNSNWNTAANWSLNAVPTNAHDVVININANILIDASSTINSLNINGNSIVSFTSSGAGRTITIDNSGSSIALGSTLTLQGSSGTGTRSMTIAFTGVNNTMGIAGTLILSDVGEGTIYNATNSLTTVSGLLKNDDSLGTGTAGVITSTSSNLSFLSGGFYQHARNGGVIPTASWNAASTCNVTGVTGTVPTVAGFNQAFGNFTWNCTGQSANITLAANLTTINGNFTVSSTSASQLILSAGTASTLSVLGNFLMTNGTLNFNSGANVSAINVAGNFTHTAGTITESGTGQGSIVFNGNTTQTYTSGGTVTNTINYTVNNGSTLLMADDATVVGNGSSGTFTLASGATLGVTSTDGITTSGATGNIRVSGSRTFSAGANYIYNGSGIQATGTGLSQNTPANLTINNPTTVTLSSATIISGNLLISQGKLTTTPTNLITIANTATNAIVGGSASSFINGPVNWTLPSNLVSGSTYIFPVGSGTTYLPFALVNPTTSGAASAQVEAVVGTSGGTANVDAILASKSNTEYWSLTTTGSFTNGSVSLTRPTAITPNDVVGASTSLTGTYTSLLGTAGTFDVSNSNPINTNRYFALAREMKSISTGAITGTTFCSGAILSVPYTILGTYISGNIFTAQLSDASGSFASPVTIGTVTSTTSGSISATIPTNTPTGTGYRIRVVSSNPAITGTDNGTNLTIYTFPSAPTTTGSFICIGTTSGTVLSASGAVSGEVYKWYSAATDGTLLKTSTNNTDNTYTTPTLAATTSYWVAISNGGNCETARTQVTATYPTASVADQTLAGTNTWIGHIYDGVNLNTYYGTVAQTETFDQSFTGATTCFPFTEGVNSHSIYTEQFSVRYRMNSTKKGLYVVDLGSDDGSRLYVDGNLIFNNWTDQAFVSRPRVLISLTGSSPLIYDFYENGGQNRVVFQNLTPVLTNNLSTNTTQSINAGSTGASISGDVYGTLPTGISLSGTGYQWTYSTTPGGARTNIVGATGATYTPDATIAPFNTGGTYYIYRNAVVSSSNNVSPNPYVSTNESNAATLNVYIPTITTSVSTLTDFSYIVGNGPSSEQTFTVEGINLNDNISITPPTNYEISTTSGSGFQSSPISITQTGGAVATTTIYVRLKAGLPAGNYNLENIIASSTYATSKNVTCSGSITTPTITTSTSSLSGFNYDLGAGPSAEQSFTVSGSSLTTNISVSPSTNFEISTTSGSGFQSTPITLNQSGGIVSTTTIYVRLKSGLAVGTYTSQNIAASSSGAITQNVALSGSVNQTYCASSGNTSYQTSVTLVNFNTINNSTAKPAGYNNYTALSTTVYTGNAYNLTVNLNTDGDYLIYAIAWIDWNQDGDFADSGETYSLGSIQNVGNGPTSLSPLSINIPANALPGNTRMRVSAKWNLAATACETGFDGEVEDYTINVIIPTITTGTITGSPFNAGSSVSVPFTASSGFVSGNIFTAQLSNSSGSFASPVNIGTLTSATSGTINATIPSNSASGSGYRIRVVSSTAIIGTDNGTNLTINNVPLLSATPTTLSGFTYQFTAGPSAIQSFTVNGSNLLDNVVVSSSTSFEVSLTTGTNFSAQPFVTLPVSGATVNRLVYVRMKAGLSIGSIATENLIISTQGAANINVSCSGTVTAQPIITVSTSPVTNPVSISGFTATFKGTASATQNFTVSGLNLMGNVTLEAPTGYEIKTSAQSVYVTSLPLTPSGSTLAATTINVRLKSGLGVGTYNGNIVASSSFAVSKTVILSGVVNPVATLTTSTSWLAGFIYSGTGPSASQSFQLYGTNLGTNNVSVTPPADFELSTDGTNWNTSVFTISPTSGSVNQIVYARLRANRTAGTAYGPQNVTLSATGAVVKTVALNGFVANVGIILVSRTTLTGFGYLFGSGPSVSQSVTVSGALLSNNITVTPPANYEIFNPSTGQFQSTDLTLTRSGTTVQATEVLIRLKAGLVAANYTGDITVSSSPVTSKTVSVTGKVFAVPLISTTGGGNYCIGDNINLTSTGSEVESRFWTGPNNFYSILNNPTLTNATQAMSGAYTVTGNVIVGGNLIYNGDFEMGNTGVGSSYTYVAPVANALQPEDLYSIVALPSSVHSNFNNVADHTLAPGTLQMVINGNRTAGVVVWSQSVSVVQNANYEFSYWLQTVVNGIDPAPSKLQLYVNGEMAGPIYNANPNTGIWTQYIYNTNAGTNNILNLELINQTTAANGNDFALDDISFKQILSSTSTENVVVSPSVVASVTVTHSPTNVYQNAPVVFTANPVNGGTTPTYKWFVDGVEQIGQTNQTFSYTPTSTGTINVTCQMTSSITCATPKPAIGSDPINVQPPLVNYWMGGIDTDWGKTGNWTANYIPATGDNVIYATVANYGTAAVRNLQLDINRTIGSLINATIRSLIIPPALTLIVNNTISVTPPTTIPVTNAQDLVLIKASLTLPNGSIKFNNPQNSPAYGTVEMYSPASWDLTKPINQKYNWQFFGIPVASLPALPTFYGAYVRELFESDKDTATHWRTVSNNYVLQPFKGYELCQQNANKLYTFKGQLVNSNYSSGKFIKTTDALYPGQHLFANPYTTAIDIRQIVFGENVEATAYMYATGSFIQWRNIKNNNTGAIPGQYFAVPKEQAGGFGIPRMVPSMGTLMVRVATALQPTDSSHVKFNYNIVSMGNTERQRVKTASTTDSQAATTIEVEGENGADKMWLMSHENYTRNFDNGFDGKKLIGNALSPQLYAVENDGKYQINSVDDINNTTLAFQAGQDTEYKITFTHDENSLLKYKKMYLHDLVENRVIDISLSGTEYVFNSNSAAGTKLRFKILSQKLNVADNAIANTKVYAFDNKIFVQNFSDKDGTVYVYDISGKTIGIKPIRANENIQFSTPGSLVYIVKTIIDTKNEVEKIFLK